MRRQAMQQLTTFFGLFGGAVDRQRALDMSRRVVPVQMGAVAACAIVALAGAGHHGLMPAALVATSEAAFLAAVLLPGRMRRPELPLVGFWMAGQGLLIAAAATAGEAMPVMLAMSVISIVFVGVIWTLRLSLMAVALTFAGLGLAMVLAPPALTVPPLVIVLPTVLMLMLTAVSASSLRQIDHASRGNVLTDQLTGVRNRIALRDQLAAIGTSGRAAGVIVIDLDHFKQINDIHGHAVGDSVLVSAAIRLEEALADVGTLFRYGGEEFVAVIRTDMAARTSEIAERLRSTLSGTPIGGLTVTASAGSVAAAPEHGLSGSELFRLADRAMYDAKEQGRNRVCSLAPTASRDHGTPAEQAPPAPQQRAAAPRFRRRGLINSVVQRDQLHEILRHVRPGRVRGLNAILVLTGAALIPAYGPAPAIVLSIRALILDPAVREQFRAQRDSAIATAAPFAEAAVSMALIGAAIMVADGDALHLLPLLALPVLSVSAAYPCVVAVLLTAESALISAAAALAHGHELLAGNPAIILTPVAIVASIALVGATVGRSAVEHRTAAIIDPLTGLLNRAALDLRLPDISAEAAQRRSPVAVIVGDLDHFKQINDIHGHDVGDRVLAEAGSRIRHAVRTLDTVYRVGGEEVVIVLPSTQTGAARQVAERVRAAVEAEPIAGIDVTISLGVAGSPGESFRYSEAFSRADAALIEAKRAGRNRVVTAPPALRAIAAA